MKRKLKRRNLNRILLYPTLTFFQQPFSTGQSKFRKQINRIAFYEFAYLANRLIFQLMNNLPSQSGWVERSPRKKLLNKLMRRFVFFLSTFHCFFIRCRNVERYLQFMRSTPKSESICDRSLWSFLYHLYREYGHSCDSKSSNVESTNATSDG